MSGGARAPPQARLAIYELERFAEVGKLEGLRDVVFLNNIPSVDLPLQRGEFLTL